MSIKKFLIITLGLIGLSFNSVYAENIAVVNFPRVLEASNQLKNLRMTYQKQNKELASFIQKAQAEVDKQTDVQKKKSIAANYEKQIQAKREQYTKEYQTKLTVIDNDIKNTVAQQAKKMGYTMVITKSTVLYGGKDITDAIVKVVK